MSATYPHPDDPNFIDDLLSRKEFYSLKISDHDFRLTPAGHVDALEGRHLKIHSHQLFVSNFISPDTPYKRLHLMHGTGTGKTIAAISIAMKFIDVYAKLWKAAATGPRQLYTELDKTTPTIFVFGFAPTKTAFYRDLLKYPEFGFVTVAEREEYIKLNRMANAGLPDDVKHFKEFYGMLRKRVTNKSTNGFFKFYGWDEFVNRLFTSESVDLQELEDMSRRQRRQLSDIIAEHIENGSITINTALLAQFKNSLVICDEIHNTYNTHSKNKRGVALQYILDLFPDLRAITMSATPISNSPTEVVELLNYLVPPDQKITKRDIFVSSREVKPGGYELIARLSRGRISFLQDSDIRYFPQRILQGQPLQLPAALDGLQAGDYLPYLRFVECPMSQIHQATWIKAVSERPGAQIDEEAFFEEEEMAEAEVDRAEEIIPNIPHSLPHDGRTLFDMVFPNPENDETGIYRSRQLSSISAADQKWRDAVGVGVVRQGTITGIVTGQFLRRENIAKYSTKYSKMLEHVLGCMKETAGNIAESRKIMIYHNWVKMSGVTLIQEILRTNGFVDEWSEPTDGTICVLCGVTMHDHGAAATSESVTKHQFYPARFIIANYTVDKVSLNNSMLRFNAPSNIYGTEFLVMIGSSIIREGYDFKDVQELLVTSFPVNIPTLNQVYGRCIRKNSHEHLPPEKRRVNVNMFITTVNPAFPSSTPLSPEVVRYADKLLDYKVIQRIEYEMNRSALDGDIHRKIVMPAELADTYFAPGQERIEANATATIGNLYFEPTALTRANLTLPAEGENLMGSAEHVTLSTFIAYRHYEAEIETMVMIIKRLFLAQPVWKYIDLWSAVKAPPFGIETNPALFSEHNFIIALSKLVTETADVFQRGVEQSSKSTLELNLFNSNVRDIFHIGRLHRIRQIGEFYILFPMGEIVPHPLAATSVPQDHIRDKLQAAMREMTKAAPQIMVDVETYLRAETGTPGVVIDVASYVSSAKSGVNYNAYRQNFIAQYGEAALEAAGGKITIGVDQVKVDMTSALTDYSAAFQSSIIEEAIEASIFGVTTADENQPSPELYSAIITFYSQFGIIVRLGEIKKYKDTAKQFRWGVPQLPDDTPLGYVRSRSVRLFDPQVENLSRRKLADINMAEVETRWFDINKLALNRHMAFRENQIIIGYLESAADETLRFKLRKPSQMIRANLDREIEMRRLTRESGVRMTVVDTRLVERGIVCTTKSKRELLNICGRLKVSVPAPTQIKIREICELIKRSLLKMESVEREKDSKNKYFYGWWDELPSLV